MGQSVAGKIRNTIENLSKKMKSFGNACLLFLY